MDVRRPQNLDKFRFTPTDHSRRVMMELKKQLPDIQKKFEHVKAIVFFGSRLFGRERPEILNEASDLDTVVFYDGSVFDTEDSSERVQSVVKNAERVAFEKGVKYDIEDRMEPLNLTAEEDPWGGEKTIHTLDISAKATADAVDEFVKEYNKRKALGMPYYETFSRSEFVIISRFFPGKGKELYRTREQVLNLLEEKGDEYFQTFMKRLQLFERNRVRDDEGKVLSFAHYPATIDEAKNLFLKPLRSEVN